uniref:RNA-directed RNA polymerase n=1 Tax=Wenzhou tombus-like virus 13 TaxID=1923666 RepID=A0A1L3KGW4_9VIRU|nr:hypothetical protein 2 [Wenzhou tombus-like virus 13]
MVANNFRICPVDGKLSKAHKILQFKSDIIEIENYGIFNQNVENEFDALSNRHLGFNTRPMLFSDIVLLNDQYDLIADSIKDVHYQPLSHTDLIKSKSGPLRKRYDKVYKALLDGERIRHKVEAFIKHERFTEEKLETKPPRLIQHRSYEFVYLLNKYLQPLDKALMNSDNLVGEQTIRSHFGKAKSMEDIGEQIHELWKEFENPVALCVDQKVFDAHYMVAHHLGEQRIYRQFKEIKDNIGFLLDKLYYPCQAVTQCGISYTIRGERCSGEYTTSMGNSCTNIAIIRSVMILNNINKFRIVVNGDDSIILIEQKDLAGFNVNLFRRFGMDPKLDRVAFTMEEIEFCQCSPILFNGKYKLIRNPSRVIGKACLMIGDYAKCIDRYIASIGLCELALNAGTPVLQDFALCLIALSNGARPLDSCVDYKARFEPKLDVKAIGLDSRVSFENAFNISVADQIKLETDLKAIVKSIGKNLQSKNNIKQFIEKYNKFHIRKRDINV